MKKIVITGALGYIGFELCKLYSGFSWKYEVIALDNRFISERVNELKRRKIKFIQADILDKESNPLILVLAWNFFDEIKKNIKTITKNIINIKSLEKNEIN